MTWPPSLIAISLLLAILFLTLSIILRGMRNLDEGKIFSYVFNAFGTAFVLGNLFFPAVWTSASYIIRRGTVEENLYPGAGIQSFMYWTFGISVLVGGVAIFRFFDGLIQNEASRE